MINMTQTIEDKIVKLKRELNKEFEEHLFWDKKTANKIIDNVFKVI